MQLQRVWTLLYNMVMAIENLTGEEIMGTDLEDEIGITQEEYDEIKIYKP